MQESFWKALFLGLLAVALGCSEPADEPPADAGSVPGDTDAGTADTPDSGAPACDPSRCHPGNICVQDRCMLACERHTGCPDGYDCRTVEGKQVCVENNLEFGRKMFGYGCGINGDADCDAAKGFVCVGGKDDPDSYCSRSGCTSDSECPGNYYCEELDWSDGTVKAVCLKRGFCAPASGLVDCNDLDAVYAVDLDGKGFCSKACSGADPNECGGGNGCFDTPQGFQCWPRAKTCEPTKSFCSRCSSRNDCPEGAFCYYESFSKERFCTLADCSQANPCPTSEGGRKGYCYQSETWATTQCLPYNDADGKPPHCWQPCPQSGCP